MSLEEHRILEFLRGTSAFLSVIRITLKVGGRKLCRAHPRWAEPHLLRLTALGLLEIDTKGRFRYKAPEKVQLAPHIAEILARSKAA